MKNYIPEIPTNPPADLFPFFTLQNTTPESHQRKKVQIQHSLEWYRLIRNIPEEKLRKILNIAKSKGIDDISDLLIALGSPRLLWEMIIRNKGTGHVEFTAFAACQQNFITVAQFSTVQMLCTGATTYYKSNLEWNKDVIAYQIYDNDVKNNDAVLILRQACKIFDSQKFFQKAQYTPLPKIQNKFHKFIDAIKNLPTNEQTLFLIRRNDRSDSDELVRELTKYGFVPFTYLIKDAIEYVCIPSKSMMQLLLNSVFGENASIMVSCLGNIEERDVANDGALGQRVFNMTFPFLETPKLADSHKTTDVGFWIHDFYHNYLVSAIPSEHRQAFTRLYFTARNIFSDPDYTLDWIRDHKVSAAMNIIKPELSLPLEEQAKTLLKNSKGTSLYTPLATLILGNALESADSQDIKKALANIPAHPQFASTHLFITRLIDLEFSFYMARFLGINHRSAIHPLYDDFLYQLMWTYTKYGKQPSSEMNISFSIIIELICDIYTHFNDDSSFLGIQLKSKNFLSKLKVYHENDRHALAAYSNLVEKLFAQKDLTKPQQIAIIHEAIDSSIHQDSLSSFYKI